MKRRHHKKKTILKIFAIAALSAALIFGASIYFFNGKGDVVVAKVNDQKIYKSELQNRLRNAFESQNFGTASEVPDILTLPKEVIEILAKEIYLDRELTKTALKSKAAKTNEFKEKIAEAKDRLVRQAYVNSVLKEKVGDQQIQNKYAELSNNLTGKKEYLISHIVTKTKEEAEKIAQELHSKKAPKFADLAKKYSIDQDSVASGGNLGYILEDNMFKEISDVIVTLKKDQISQPIQTKFGWHLLKVSDTRDAVALPFESVKENIREQLTQDVFNEINSKITKDAKVRILVKLAPEKASEAAATTETKPSTEVKDNSVAAPETTTEKAEEAPAATEKTETKPEKSEKNETKKHTKKNSKHKK